MSRLGGEVSLGVLAGTGGTARLSRLVGKAKAMEIMVTGRKFSYEEAKEMASTPGLVAAPIDLPGRAARCG